MTLPHLIRRKIRHRGPNFALGVFGVAVAVAWPVAQLTVLRLHDLWTEEIIAAKEAETRARLATINQILPSL
jgi:hypothetical protein